MEFTNNLLKLSELIAADKTKILVEEATKTSFILPFINNLGFNVFNTDEVQPEYVCDIGTKKGEKIDYVLKIDSKPIILMECKHWKENLNNHISQLFRYYHCCDKVKIGILTNGLEYRFYTDTKVENKMDDEPFFIFDMENVNLNSIKILQLFHKNNFNVENIKNFVQRQTAYDLFKSYFNEMSVNPSVNFMKFILKECDYVKRITQPIIDATTPILKSVINDFTNSKCDFVNIKSEIVKVESKIITTEEEIQSYEIIKDLLKDHVNIQRITYKDYQSYFNITIDNNNRKTVCKISMKPKKMVIIFSSKEKYELASLNDIKNYKDKLIDSLNLILNS